MERSPQRPRLARTFAWLIYLTPLLVILQAFLFGSFYEKFNSDLIDKHRDVGFISMILVVVLAILAYFARFPRESRVLHLAIALAFLWIIQWLLGSLTSEEARWVAILHVPNGLLVFGLALLLAGMTHRTLAASSRRSREGVQPCNFPVPSAILGAVMRDTTGDGGNYPRAASARGVLARRR